MSSFDIEIEGENDFCLFTSLLRDGTGDVCSERLASCISIASQLGNAELVKQLFALHPLPAEFTSSNMMEEFRFYEMAGEVPPVELVRFASQNFYRLTQVLANQLEPETLDLIFSETLLLTSEDQFFDFLKAEVCDRSIDLLRHVELCCLSESKYEEFMELLDPSALTPGIWARIRSIRPDRTHSSKVHQYGLQIPYVEKFFDGIFAHFSRIAGGNCVEKGVIAAKCSHNGGGDLSILFAANDWSGDRYWRHGSVLNGWFKVDFKGWRVSVTHYAIHNSVKWVQEHHFLKSWTLEGSNTDSDSDSDWTKIDSRTDDETLHGATKLQGVFYCNGDTTCAFRFIRLVQRGTSHDPKYYYFCISQIEIFGRLLPSN
jgi:hypothetical protein